MQKSYANTIALVAFLGIILVGGFFYLMSSSAVTVPVATSTATTTQTTPTNSYYTDTSTWQTDSDSTAGFSIMYPIDFDVNANTAPTPTTDWRLNANGNPGNLSFTLTIPKAFEPQTNFSDAKLTVGESANAAAVSDCLTPDPTGGPSTSMTTQNINGTVFTIFSSSDAGAGNFYETTSYRTISGGKCYAIEYTIHSANIANFPPSYNLQPFDEAKVKDVLDRIVGTFTFL